MWKGNFLFVLLSTVVYNFSENVLCLISLKENITKIAYESWHWRYVGKEHAQKMNELNMCLEEYVEYLQKGN